MKFTPPSRAASAVALSMVLLLATTIFAQQFSTKATEEGKTAKLVAEMVGQYHIKQAAIDDAISSKLLDAFLKQIDPQKLYFTQDDIDGFAEYRTKLDDLIKAGNVEFAYTTYDLYLKRLDERIALAHQFIDAEHDFTVDESMSVDFDKMPWAKSNKEITDRWRKRIKYDLLSAKLTDAKGADGKIEPKKPGESKIEDPRKRLHKRYDVLKSTMHQTENSEKLEMFLSSLCHCFDPHSSYMSPETLDDFQIQMRLSLDGIGAALRQEDGFTVVAEIVAGGAAAEDGRLKVGDKIIGVAQGEGEFVDVVEMKLSKVVRFIRGKRGTPVRLQVKLAAGDDVKVYELIRKKIELKSSEVKGEIIRTGDRFKDNSEVRIGVIHIPSFYRDFGGAQDGVEDFKSTARDVRAVLKQFRTQGGVDGVVVDLRTNGGGALKEAIDVTGLFIDQGPVVQIKEPDGTVKSHDDDEAGVAYDGPLVVLCNRLSASASEIFAGAIRDYNRGIVIGDTTTHGKGTVQNVIPVPSRTFAFVNGNTKARGALKLTINQFYRVNGDSTQNRGVESDIVLPSLVDHMDLGESFLENALAFDKIKTAEHASARMLSDDLISTLKRNSQTRVAADPDFQKAKGEIEKFIERKNRKTISLNEETLKKERESEKAQEKEEEKLKDPSEKTGEQPIFPEGAYNNEVLRITTDYTAALRGMKTAGK